MSNARVDLTSLRYTGQRTLAAGGNGCKPKTSIQSFISAKVTKPCSASRTTASTKAPDNRSPKIGSPKTPTRNGRMSPSIDRAKRCSSPLSSGIPSNDRNSPFAQVDFDFLHTPTRSVQSHRRRRLIDSLQTDSAPTSSSSDSRPVSRADSFFNSSPVSNCSRSSSPDILSLSPTCYKSSAPPATAISNQERKQSSSQTTASCDYTRNIQTSASPGPKATYSGRRTLMVAQDRAFNCMASPPQSPSKSSDTSISGNRISKCGKSRRPCHKNDNALRRKQATADLLQLQLPYRNISDEDGVSGSTVMKNVHELRRAEEHPQFETLVDSLFDGLEDETASIARQRDCLAQISKWLLDEQFARRFLANSLQARLAKCQLRHDDFVSAIFRVCVYALLMTVPTVSSSAFRACAETCLSDEPLLIQLLDEEDDMLTLLRSPKMDMSSPSQAVVSELLDTMRTTRRLWGDQVPATVTPRLLGLRCVEMIVQRARETRDSLTTLSESVLVKLVDIVLWTSRRSHRTKSMDDHTCHILSLTLSTLESFTAMELGALTPTQETALRRLSKLGRLSSKLSRLSLSRRGPLQDLQIRLILNVTNNRPNICDDFSNARLLSCLLSLVLCGSEAIAKDEDDSSNTHEPVPEYVFNSVILALGCLVNLTESSEKARKTVSTMESGMTLQSLVHLYRARMNNADQAESVEQTHLNVIFGYLSVLLTTLSLDNYNRAYFREALSLNPPRPFRPAAGCAKTIANKSNGVRLLLSTVGEFLDYYRKVDDEDTDMVDEEEEEEEEKRDKGRHRDGFARRLDEIVTQLKAAEKGEAGLLFP